MLKNAQEKARREEEACRAAEEREEMLQELKESVEKKRAEDKDRLARWLPVTLIPIIGPLLAKWGMEQEEERT